MLLSQGILVFMIQARYNKLILLTDGERSITC